MKIIIYYIDPDVTKIFNEKVDENGNKSLVLSSPHNFVYRDELIAKIINADSVEQAAEHIDKKYGYHKIVKYTQLKAGDGVYYDDLLNCYKASGYGFARLDKNTAKISLLEPIQIPKNKLKAYYLIHPTKLKALPTFSDIEETMVKRKIFSGLNKDDVEKQLKGINPQIPKIHRITAASGREPIDGYEEYFTPLIKIEKEVGKILEDGSIDFKEVSSVIDVKKGQEILRRIPAVPTEDGYDIFGESVPANVKETDGFQRGANIVQSGHDESIYVSSINGCLEVKKKIISISPIAIIKGDVDYNSGNIDFDGSVQINGSVLSGFSVKAKDNIIVGKNVEDANLEAGGDVRIKLGIGGKGTTTVLAGGMVRAKFVINSTIEAVKEIVIEDSIINSNVFSNDKIIVVSKHGKIIGGEATALYDIIVNESGVLKENKTVLTVGKSLFIEREIKKIQDQIKPIEYEVEEINAKLKTSFGEDLFINTKEYLKILPPVKKKNCIELLSKMQSLTKDLKIIKEKLEFERQKLKLDRDPVVVIRDKAFPGTIIKIKNSVRLIDKEFENVKFYEDRDQKIIKFTAANRDATSSA
ncbi:MAG: FapA family protein [Spirochaetes bacterium]|nr:FapA family protein [Spirochaetota bacterium]